jgi:hypothetical protein
MAAFRNNFVSLARAMTKQTATSITMADISGQLIRNRTALTSSADSPKLEPKMAKKATQTDPIP